MAGGWVVDVADWGWPREVSLFGLLGHALLDLFRHVVDVAFRHQDLDPMNEFFMGPGFAGEDRELFVEVELEVALLHQLIEQHPVFEVPVQPIGLFDDQDPTGLVLLEECDHLLELLASALFGRLDVYVLADDSQSEFLGVGQCGLGLGGNRVAFVFLFLRGHANIVDGVFAG
ncbi:hypothetical protein D3C87_1327460 [compost metagenome]